MNPKRPAHGLNARSLKVVGLAFIVQNCMSGLTFGAFGPLLASTESQLNIDRTQASGLMSAMVLSMGLLIPIFGRMLQRHSARTGYVVGALATAIGCLGLATTSSYAVALAMYVLIGVGASLISVLAPIKLISQWFDATRARMLAVVNLPIGLATAPLLVASLLPVYGRSTILLAAGALFLILTPFLLLLSEPRDPVAAGATATAPSEPEKLSADANAPLANSRPIASPIFWLVTLSLGTLSGTGTAYLVHIVPFGRASGMTLAEASSVLTIFAIAGMPGVLTWGWYADRIGTLHALAVNALCQAIGWGLMILLGAPGIFLSAALLGFCISAIVPLHGASFSYLYGPAKVSQTVGLSYFIKLPLLFSIAPLVGLLDTIFGGYVTPFAIVGLIVATASAAIGCCILLLRTVTAAARTA